MAKNEQLGLAAIDVDGIVNYNATNVYQDTTMQILEYLDVEVPSAAIEVAALRGTPPKRLLVGSLSEHSGLRKAAIKLYDELIGPAFDAKTKPVPGSAEALERLKAAGYVLAINSSTDLSLIRDVIFPKAGIDMSIFDPENVWTLDRLIDGQEKPNPHVLRRIMRHTGIPKERTMMIGDSPVDYEAAVQAGVTPVMVLSGNVTKEEVELTLPDAHVIEDITHVDEVAFRTIGWAGLELARAN